MQAPQPTTFLRINDCMEILDLHSIVLAILYANTAAHTAGLSRPNMVTGPLSVELQATCTVLE